MPSDAELYRLRKSLTCKQIAEQFNLNADSVRRRANRYKGKSKIIPLDNDLYYPSARDDTDWSIWTEHLRRLGKLNRMIMVHTMSDMHMPDEHIQAVSLSCEINCLMQPDITILGSDAFDFDVLSMKFPRMYNRKRVDPFEEVRARYDSLVDRLLYGNPNGILVAIGDNHAQGRLEALINSLVPFFGDMITSAYNALIRSNNRVLWLGWQQEAFIHETVFEHGKKAGVNPALANFKRRGTSSPVIAGHSHRWQQVVEVKQKPIEHGSRILYYPLVSAVTGCLQNIPPHYVTDTKAVNWTLGSSLTHVNLKGLDTHVQNILYHPREDGSLVAVVGREVIIQDAMSDIQVMSKRKAKAA